ncbi:MAG: protein kinase, partial [Candidatus Margulisbacteria bacterium]|nr:protein kinase [Candidatus Margulisiibacteriota bacterium]
RWLRAEDLQASVPGEKFVAIKMILPMVAEKSEIQDRFYLESKYLQRLKKLSPQFSMHFLRIKHSGTTEDGTQFMVTVLLTGPNLKKFIEDGKRFDSKTAAGHLLSLLNAMKAATELPDGAIVHRDIKPENVNLETFRLQDVEVGALVLMDFGISKSTDDNIHLTETDKVVGTPLYQAPEAEEYGRRPKPQTAEEKKEDLLWLVRMDIFSLGKTIWETVTGQEAFGIKNRQDLNDFRKGDRRFTLARPEIMEDGLFKILSKMMAIAPDKRYQGYAEIIAAVNAYLLGDAIKDNAPQQATGDFSQLDDKGKLQKLEEMLKGGDEAAATEALEIIFNADVEISAPLKRRFIGLVNAAAERFESNTELGEIADAVIAFLQRK